MRFREGTLPVGVEIDGKNYRDFKYRSQLVRDAVEIMDQPDAARADKSDSYFAVCMMAKRLSLVGIPKESITPALILDMEQIDFNHLVEIDKEIKAQRASFRDAAEAAPDAAIGTPKAGI